MVCTVLNFLLDYGKINEKLSKFEISCFVFAILETKFVARNRKNLRSEIAALVQ